MKIIIMRGLPGSGKSTWVCHYATNFPKSMSCSADHYHTTPDGYKYDPKNAGIAHSKCLKKYVTELINPKAEFLFVDNTNTSLVEIAPYVRLAQAYGVEFEIMYKYCDLERSLRCNTHEVPLNTILAMQANLLTEKLPPDWKQRVIL